ncbi:MAG: hypothetical protein ISP01_05230 [Methanobrevibacter arboriphilus]|uniref:Uncharacterized protein n=1 Tax=Methanobrevibacter arboriphilus TaxID=39441 RepID=A0A843APT0_METAZ|nr:phage tail tube protein [Methanobrevibacter arboriphilus]MBF4468790.1 hypothetical protein [Methanobrevibacter arboriphilus]
MSYYYGKTGYMVIQVQDTPGTPDTFTGADGEIGLPITDQPDLKPTIEKDYPQIYRKSKAERTDYIIKKLGAEGKVAVSAYTGGPLETILYGIFGNVQSSLITDTTTAYANSYSMGKDLPLFTTAVGIDDLDYQEFYDIRFGDLEINMESGSEVTLSSSVTGRGGAIGKNEIPDDKLNYTKDTAFAFDDLGVSLGGNVNCDVTSANIKIDRGIKSLRTACPTAAKGDNMIYPTTIDVSGSFEMLFQNRDEYKYWLGGSSATEPTFNQNASTTGRELVLEMTGGPIGDGVPVKDSSLKITCPCISYDDVTTDMPFDDLVKVKFDFMSLEQAGSTISAEVNSEFNAQTILV